ncbi:Zinc finger protein 302 [Frankliniella fusca]|uniref:Zinc finger protein 302 n=1 Tax=Frankliniella fusca TaxID=407009 RepID=A0AAE1HEL9_9NEOP|nr:Zinc finger protein 302 [Frankliniella fusca]
MELDMPSERIVTVVARDTDIVAILVARAVDDTRITVAGPGKTATGDSFSIRTVRRNLVKNNMVDIVLLAHAFSGCDTTSAIYKKGKVQPWMKLEENYQLRECAKVFNDPSASRGEISKAGEKLSLSLYCGGVEVHGCEDLDALRDFDYMAKTLSGTFVNLATLPPTSLSSEQHSNRVYLQVQQWLSNLDIVQTDWGWKPTAYTLEPVPTTCDVAPVGLLKKLSCNCALFACRTFQCSCLKRGESCSPACGKCKGRTCGNPEGYVADGGWDDVRVKWNSSPVSGSSVHFDYLLNQVSQGFPS